MAEEFRINTPYPGLRPFLPQEHPIFFGRDQQINRLFRKLQTGRFVAVVGSSGSGKSSLLRAGLYPILRNPQIVGDSKWCVVEARPGSNPFQALATGLLTKTDELDGTTKFCDSTRDLLAFDLRGANKGLHDHLSAFPRFRGRKTLIVIDQFEELFAYRWSGRGASTPEEEVLRFIQLLLDAVSHDDGETTIRIMIGVRSDFIGACSIVPDLALAVSENQFLVPDLTSRQKLAAITLPGKAAHKRVAFPTFEVDPALAHAIVNDTGERPDGLCLMQHVLLRIWQHARTASGQDPEPLRLTLDHYDNEIVGRVGVALDRDVQTVWSSISQDSEQALVAKRLFLLLHDRTSTGLIVRRKTTIGEVCAVTEKPANLVVQVVKAFQANDRNFLLPLELDPNPAPTTSLDICHESLLREWRMFRTEWMREESRYVDELRRWFRDSHPHAGAKPEHLSATYLARFDEWSHWATDTWALRYLPPISGTEDEAANRSVLEEIRAFADESRMQLDEESRAEEARRIQQALVLERERMADEARLKAESDLAGARAALSQNQRKLRSSFIVFGCLALLTSGGILYYFLYVVPKLTSARAELGSTKSELERTKSELKSKNGELGSTKSALESKNSELNSIKGQIEGLETALITNKESLDQVQSDLEAARGDVQQAVARQTRLFESCLRHAAILSPSLYASLSRSSERLISSETLATASLEIRAKYIVRQFQIQQLGPESRDDGSKVISELYEELRNAELGDAPTMSTRLAVCRVLVEHIISAQRTTELEDRTIRRQPGGTPNEPRSDVAANINEIVAFGLEPLGGPGNMLPQNGRSASVFADALWLDVAQLVGGSIGNDEAGSQDSIERTKSFLERLDKFKHEPAVEASVRAWIKDIEDRYPDEKPPSIDELEDYWNVELDRIESAAELILGHLCFAKARSIYLSKAKWADVDAEFKNAIEHYQRAVELRGNIMVRFEENLLAPLPVGSGYLSHAEVLQDYGWALWFELKIRYTQLIYEFIRNEGRITIKNLQRVLALCKTQVSNHKDLCQRYPNFESGIDNDLLLCSAMILRASDVIDRVDATRQAQEFAKDWTITMNDLVVKIVGIHLRMTPLADGNDDDVNRGGKQEPRWSAIGIGDEAFKNLQAAYKALGGTLALGKGSAQRFDAKGRAEAPLPIRRWGDDLEKEIEVIWNEITFDPKKQ
jgi:energy-coupling factor transporter ATP-binding protein EcfA2